MVNRLLRKYATNQAIAENGAAILRYVQLSYVNPQHYANELIVKSCKVAEVFDERTLNDMSIEIVDASIMHSLRKYCRTNPHEILMDIALQAESLLYILKGSGNNVTGIYPNVTPANPCTRKPYNRRSVASAVTTEKKSTLIQRTQRSSSSLQ